MGQGHQAETGQGQQGKIGQGHQGEIDQEHPTNRAIIPPTRWNKLSCKIFLNPHALFIVLNCKLLGSEW